MLKNPAHGYGKNINPCIDCHGMMLKKSEKIMRINGFDFAATGEVLGQRSMSQNKQAMDLVKKISNLNSKLVRPMSAKLLDESEPEKQGKINRKKLLDISGRSRRRQLELAKKYHIKEYANSNGGCLLTDPIFSEKLFKMFRYWPNCNGNDIKLLKNGRVFWITTNKALMIMGRNNNENKKLKKLAKKNDIIIELINEAGPTTLIRTKNNNLK